MDPTVKSAVNGWNQAVGIMRRLRDGLSFTVAEMEAANRVNPRAFATDAEKAMQFVSAKEALETANRYLAAFNHG